MFSKWVILSKHFFAFMAHIIRENADKKLRHFTFHDRISARMSPFFRDMGISCLLQQAVRQVIFKNYENISFTKNYKSVDTLSYVGWSNKKCKNPYLGHRPMRQKRVHLIATHLKRYSRKSLQKFFAWQFWYKFRSFNEYFSYHNRYL